MADSQSKQAQIIALRLLAASPKSKREIARKLKEKGFPVEIVEKSLNDLESRGLLNDRAYAQNLANKFRVQKPSGKRKIQFELKRHGIDAKLSEELLEQDGEDQELKRAREIAETKWDQWFQQPLEKRKKRLYDFLARRGFAFSVCREAIEELKGSHADEGR